jgi:hypothetical protein
MWVGSKKLRRQSEPEGQFRSRSYDAASGIVYERVQARNPTYPPFWSPAGQPFTSKKNRTCLASPVRKVFSSKAHFGFFGNLAFLLSGTVFTTIGVVIGDTFRRFVIPDTYFTTFYLPIQKRLKITPSKSSDENWPVMLDS